MEEVGCQAGKKVEETSEWEPVLSWLSLVTGEFHPLPLLPMTSQVSADVSYLAHICENFGVLGQQCAQEFSPNPDNDPGVDPRLSSVGV